MKVVAAVAVVLLLVVMLPGGTGTGGHPAGRLVLMGAHFSVSFTQSTLPGSVTWFVNITNQSNPLDVQRLSGTGSPLSGSEPNGSYSYTVEVGDKRYAPTPATGMFSVMDGSVTTPVTFTLVTYTVKFTESGLPAATKWWVNITSPAPQSFSSVISTNPFPEPNGSYSYTVATGNKAFAPSPAAGMFSVNGGPTNQAISFGAVTFAVTFAQTGLPGGIRWWVNITSPVSQSFSQTGSSIVFAEPNQTYSFTVQTGNPSYAPSPSSGMFTVNGAPVNQPVTFTLIAFTVTFTETNLPAGTFWWVNITSPAPQSFPGAGTTISFSEPDGTYLFKIASANKSWAPSPSHGSFMVIGGPPSPIPITFNLVTFGVAFKETGLPAFTQWGVTLSGLLTTSKTAWVNFTVINGTHSFSVSVISGYHANVYNGSVSVSGKSPPTISISWFQEFYKVYFNISGYPVGKNWSISVASVLQTTSGSSILFSEPNATSYSWSLHNWTRTWQPNVTSGHFQVSGSEVVTFISFILVTYSVSFAESGLPSQTNWSVNLNGTLQWSTLPLMSFPEPNGTYNYTVNTVNGYVPFPPGGTVHISGVSRTISIQFQPFASAVTFQEAGLAVNKSWAVTVDGVRHSSNTSAIVFNLGNGSYSFIVGSVRGYSASPTSGSFTVVGLPLTIPVNFSGVPFEVIFLPSGLLPQANWSVTFAGMTALADGGHDLFFNISNGTYPFTVGFSAFYRAYNATPYWFTHATSGNLTVNGHTVQETISYLHVPEYPVTFYETGLNPGTGWSVALGGSIVWSTSASLTILEPNGSYSYYLGFVLGYSVQNSSGIVTVNAGAMSVTVTYVGQNTSGCQRCFGIPWIYLLIGGLAVAAAVLVTSTIYVRRRSKR